MQILNKQNVLKSVFCQKIETNCKGIRLIAPGSVKIYKNNFEKQYILEIILRGSFKKIEVKRHF